MMISQKIRQQHLTAGTLSQIQIDWLKSHDVSNSAIIGDWPVNAARVTYKAGRFDVVHPGHVGENALTFLVADTFDYVDIAAWSPLSRRIGLWLGCGFALGQDQIFNPATYALEGTLRVHRTPLQWLIADRDGIAIIDPAKTYSFLRGTPRLSFSDADYGRTVRGWMKPPDIETEFFFEQAQEATAA